jgi:acyl carrier protein
VIARKTVHDVVMGYLIENLQPKEDIHLYSTLKDDLGLDSLDQTEMIMHLEQELDIVIDDDQMLDKTANVEELINLIKRRYHID